MRSGVLLIGESEQQQLTAAAERARQRPTPISEVMRTAGKIDQKTASVTFDERKAALEERSVEPHIEEVLLPVGYRVAISCEEQPAGMCLHVSMSTATPGMVPGPEAVTMLMGALGFPGWKPSDRRSRLWVEEFAVDGKPGGKAVNVIIVTDPAKGGHA